MIIFAISFSRPFLRSSSIHTAVIHVFITFLFLCLRFYYVSPPVILGFITFHLLLFPFLLLFTSFSKLSLLFIYSSILYYSSPSLIHAFITSLLFYYSSLPFHFSTFPSSSSRLLPILKIKERNIVILSFLPLSSAS